MAGTGDTRTDPLSAVRERLGPHEQKLRFLAVGAWDTLFSYGI